MDQVSPKLVAKKTQSKQKSVQKDKYEINIVPSEQNQPTEQDLNILATQQNQNFILNPNQEMKGTITIVGSAQNIDNSMLQPAERKDEAIHSNDSLEHQEIEVTAPNKRRKYIIILIIIFSLILLITGGVLLGIYLNKDSGSAFIPTIKIPENYKEYKEVIQKGQENNLVEIIYIPRSQKIYEYNIFHSQSTTQQDGKSRKTNNKISHRIGVVCTGISDKNFNMMLYFMNTTSYENSNQVSFINGYPDMIAKENRNLRILAEDEPTHFGSASEQIDESKLTMSEAEKKQEEMLYNEYAPLNDEEKEALASVGVSDQQFYNSRYPIISFDINKDGSILKLRVPINIRYDLLQIYLNVIEQISPVVSQDFYNVFSRDGKRLLKERKTVLKQRILSDDIVKKDLTASKDENGDASLTQKYSNVVKPSETSSQNTDYQQVSAIQSGALLESKVNSGFVMKDTKSTAEEEEQDGLPIMKNIDAQSTGNIKFISQQDKMEESFYNQLLNTFSSMSYNEYTHDEAIKAIKNLFGSVQDSGEPVIIDPENNVNKDYANQNQKRILQGDKQSDIFPAVTKTLFKKSFASLEFGAELRSSCYKWESGLTQDECAVGLYSFFNGNYIKVAERYTKLNVSKIQKYTNYIQNLVQDQLINVKNDMIISLNKIKNDLNNLVDRYAEIIEPKKNSLLNLFYKTDDLNQKNIYNIINAFDNSVNKAIQASNTLVDYQFKTLTSTTASFISQKQESLTGSYEQISSYYSSIISSISNTLVQMESQSQTLNSSEYTELKDFLDSINDTIEDQLNTLINEPINSMFADFEDFIQEESNKTFGDTDIIVKSIEISKNNDADQLKKSNLMKRVLGLSSFLGKLQKFLTYAQTKNGVTRALVQKASTELKNQIQGSIQQVLTVLNRMARTSSTRSAAITTILQNNQVFEFSGDLSLGFSDVKQSITQIYQVITTIQSKQTSKLVEFISAKISTLPYEIQELIKTQTDKSIQDIVDISSGMNTFFSKWTEDLMKHSSKLLSDSQELYKEVKKVLADNNWPNNSSHFSRKPANTNTDPLTQTIQKQIDNATNDINNAGSNLSNLHVKFEAFLQSMKDFGTNSYKYLNNIDIKLSNAWVDKTHLWSYLAKIALNQASASNTKISNSVKNEFEVKLKFTTFKSKSLQLSQNDISEYKTKTTSDNNFTTKETNRRCDEVLKSGDYYEKNIRQLKKIEKEYEKHYITPIGIMLKMKITAIWTADLFFETDVKSGVVDLGIGVETKVQLNGEVSASAYVAEVGGYCEGTFLDTQLKLGVKLRPLDNFKGSLYLKGTFKPYYVKFGLFYKTIFQIEKLSCDYSRRRVLIFGSIGRTFKKAVNAVGDAGKTVINEIKKIYKCITTFQPELKRNDIVDPLVLDGPTYQKTIFELTF